MLFSFLIKKFNFKTPGREDDPVAEPEAAAEAPKAVEAAGKKTANVKDNTHVAGLVEGLGGPDNINTLENCFTRLRVNVKDPSLLKDELINKMPNSGIVKKGDDIQIIFGLQVAEVRQAVEDYLKTL